MQGVQREFLSETEEFICKHRGHVKSKEHEDKRKKLSSRSGQTRIMSFLS